MTPLMKSDWAGMGWEFQWARWALPLGVSPAQWTPCIVLQTCRVPLCLSSCFLSISGVFPLRSIDLADTYLGYVWTPQQGPWLLSAARCTTDGAVLSPRSSLFSDVSVHFFIPLLKCNTFKSRDHVLLGLSTQCLAQSRVHYWHLNLFFSSQWQFHKVTGH